jgi:hypothetical protein
VPIGQVQAQDLNREGRKGFCLPYQDRAAIWGNRGHGSVGSGIRVEDLQPSGLKIEQGNLIDHEAASPKAGEHQFLFPYPSFHRPWPAVPFFNKQAGLLADQIVEHNLHRTVRPLREGQRIPGGCPGQ